ncbi:MULTISPECIES: hypothetical protein [Rhodomicrobium]|uniref:hypothetical protein n=1 Tax=Rhodomicrobium TaxID=1068 RepID=UPI000B4C0775|nr:MULTISPECIES: hypothetical protein [Rhodomicrobium]
MSLADHHANSLQRKRRRREERDYRWVFWAAFPFFLAVTLITRLNPWHARPSGHRQSVFREAWVAANSTLPFAFML